MARVSKTPEAQADLEAILEVLEEKSRNAAKRFADEVDEKCRALENFPMMGRTREEILPGLRSTLVGRYVIFYRIQGESVEVLRILHGRRDLGRIMKDGS